METNRLLPIDFLLHRVDWSQTSQPLQCSDHPAATLLVQTIAGDSFYQITQTCPVCYRNSTDHPSFFSLKKVDLEDTL